MGRELIVIILTLFLLVIGLSGCTDEKAAHVDNVEMRKFIGVWKASENDIHIFADNGACKYLNIVGTYKIEEGNLIVELNNGLTYIYNYVFSDDGNTLTLTHTTRRYTTVYTKQ